MHPESLASVQGTDSVFVLFLPRHSYRLPSTSDAPIDSSISSMSLVASRDIVELQKRNVIAEHKLKSTWATADKRDALYDTIQEFSRLKTFLYTSFEAEPFEDGMDHPAEDIIGDVIQSADDACVFDWLSKICLDVKFPTFSASILRCLGRQTHPGTEPWRTDLVEKALTVDDAEIRDAALQAAEFWGGRSMRNILKIKVQTEPLQWLRNYMQDVIDDLR